MPRRPPKKWFDKMKRKVKKEYPSYSEKRINKIVAGIWYDYKPSTRNRIIAEEQSRRRRKVGRRKEVKKTRRRKKGKKKRKGKKWGQIGAPHSAKRKRHLARIRKKR